MNRSGPVTDERILDLGRSTFAQEIGALGEVAASLDAGFVAAVRALLADGDGRLWIGTESQGLFLLSADRKSLRHFAAGPGGLGNPDVRTITQDPAGNIWVGTYGGLYKLRPHPARDSFSVSEYRHSLQNPNSLSTDRVISLMVDRGGTLWVGTFNAGLAHTIVEALDFKDDSTLVAFTRGRGAFIIGLGAAALPPPRTAGGRRNP